VIILKGSGEKSHKVRSFYWSAEELFFLCGAVNFPPHSSKKHSILPFGQRKDFCLLLELPIYVVAPTTNKNPPAKSSFGGRNRYWVPEMRRDF